MPSATRKETTISLTTQELESKLWQAADILRGQIDSADYRNYIFSILFLKRLSDRFDEEVQNAMKAGVSREVALTDRDANPTAAGNPNARRPRRRLPPSRLRTARTNC